MIYRIVVLILCYCYSYSQSVSYLDFNNKLSQNTVIALEEDSTGFLWIGTADGLNRFDGLNLVTYRHTFNNKESICGNEIIDLEIGPFNNLWIGTSSGLSILNTDNYTFSNFTTNNSKLSNDYIQEIEVTSKYTYILTPKGLDIFDIEQHKFVKNFNSDKHEILQLSKSNFEEIIISTRSTIFKFDPTNNELVKVINLEVLTDTNSLPQEIHYQDNHICVAFNKEIVVYDLESEEKYQYASHQLLQTRNITTWNNQFWISTSKGVLKFDLKSLAFSKERKGNLDFGVAIESLVNRADELFISIGTGVVKLSNKKPLFETIKLDPEYSNISGSNKVWHITNEGNNMIVCTERGIKLLNENGEIKNLNEAKPFIPKVLFASNVTLDFNTIWINTFDEGIYQIDANTKSYKNYSTSRKSYEKINSNTIRHCLKTDSSNYFSTDDGLYVYDKQQQKLKLKNINHPSYKAGNQKISCALIDNKFDLWIGTQNGLFRKKKNDKIDYFSSETSPPICHNRIRSLKVKNDSILLVGTSGGLNYLNINNSSNTIINCDNGLANDVIYSIEIDKDQDVWASTNKGISHIDKNFVVTNYNVHDGLQGDEFNTNASCIDNAGQFYFGGVNGISRFDPILVKNTTKETKTLITEIELFPHKNFKGLIHSFPTKDTYRFENEQCNFVIRFSSINFENPENDRFQYRLKGYNHDWVQISNKREAQFMNLKEGDYIFELQGINKFGKPSNPISALSISIEPLYYNTRWFRLLLMALVLIISCLIFWLRAKRIENRNLKLNKIIKKQTEKLEKSSQLKEEFLKQVPEPLIILDPNKNKILSNELYDELISRHEESHELKNSFKIFLDKNYDIGIKKILSTKQNTFEINSSFKDIDFQLKFNAFSLQDNKLGTAVIVTDISHVKKAELSIKKSEELFRSYFEKSPIGIIYVEDPSKEIVNCNQKFCEIVKMSKDEVINKTMMDLTHPDDLEKDMASFFVAAANQKHYLLEPNKKLLCKDGFTAITETHITFIYDDSNEYQYMFALINDVTEQRENQKKLLEVKSKLMQSEKLASLGQITAGVAHEINNPVNFIYNGVNNLKRLIQKDETKFSSNDELIYNEIQQMISAIEEGARRTSEIVKSLRMFTKIDINNKTNYDIIKGIESTLLLLSNRIQDRISIQKKYSRETMFINCFPSQLNQVFLNILSNSIDAIEEQGVITISVESKDSHVTIKFMDTGCGIPLELHSKVFEPFFSTKGAKNGTGLGLSISHSIIEKHKGAITIKPNTPFGTIFIITLPKQ